MCTHMEMEREIDKDMEMEIETRIHGCGNVYGCWKENDCESEVTGYGDELMN